MNVPMSWAHRSRNYIAEPDATDYPFRQVSGDHENHGAAGNLVTLSGSTCGPLQGRHLMKSLSMAAMLLMASALTPVSAADMTHERALTASSKEPQNWLLHHGNYEGHRFSQLKTIN